MQTEYLARLAPDIRSLAEEVERASGVEVVVKVAPDMARGLPDQPAALACEVFPTGAELLIPAPDCFPDGSVLHELLHVRRFLNEGVPRLTDCATYAPWSSHIRRSLALQDNCLEHLVIVPEELLRRPERRAHWERVMQRVWKELAADGLSEVERRQVALANWCFIQHALPDSAVLPCALAVLERFGLSNLAQRFYEALAPVLSDKERAVRVWFEHLGVPLEMASLEYLNTHDGTRKVIPLLQLLPFPVN
jgi:hypothetical protein